MTGSTNTQGKRPRGNRKLKLNKSNLALLISLSPTRIRLKEILKAFVPYNKIETDLNSLLDELAREDFIIPVNGNNGYKATRPWADIAYATIPEFNPDDTSVILKIKNLPEETPVKVCISKSQIDKFGLNPGDEIVCHLERASNGLNLRAFFLGNKDKEHKNHISGHFNTNAKGEIFTAGNPRIKTRFNLQRSANNDELQHRTVCYVELPDSFDIRSPSVILSEGQCFNADTGEHIDDVLVSKHKINRVWPENALAEAKRIAAATIDTSGRRLVTGITIDPPDPDEVDDMISVQRLENGGFLTQTCIADVAALVLPGSEIDKEAKERGHTFYLRDREIGMLPSIIGREKGSLLPGIDRPAICIEIEYDRDVNPVRTDIYPAIARSSAAYSYSQFSDVTLVDPVLSDLKAFGQAMSRNKNRINRTEFSAGNYVRKKISLVETFMVNASAAMAEYLQSKKALFPYRNNGVSHNPVLYKNVREDIRKLGLEMPEDPKDCTCEVQIELRRNASEMGIEEDVRRMLSSIADRSRYSTVNSGHMELRLQSYTHFTAPLRRYPDILVARAFYREYAKEHPEFSRFAQTDEERATMAQTIDHLNDLSDKGRDVRNDAARYHLLRDLKIQEGRNAHAILNYVNGKSIEILLPQTGLQNRIMIDELPPDICQLDPETHSLVFSKGERLMKGEALKGKIGKVDPVRATWEFEIAGPA